MALVIPSIFTAVDKFSAPVRGMGNTITSFAEKASRDINKIDAQINKTFSVFSAAQKDLLGTVGAVAIAAKVTSLVSDSADSIVQYEKSVANFRTIVSDLNDADFAPFKREIDTVAKDTKRSAIDVANSFEMIAGLNAEFAKTADGLGAVSTAAITLSKASGAELGTSAANLVGIMNQFDLAANEANKAINVLAAGQAVGASTINQSSEAYKNFGAVAKGANITLEQSQGLIQTLASKQLLGAEAGTKLRGSVLKLQEAGLGYKSGLFNINDALTDAKAKYDKLATAKQKDAYLNKVFGAENITGGRILLDNIDKYKQFTEQVTGTNEAQKAADINSKTLANSLVELKAAWVNMLTSSSGAAVGLSIVGGLIRFVTDHISGITTVLAVAIGLFTAWKTVMLISTATTKAFTIWTGLMAIAQGVATGQVTNLTRAMGFYELATTGAIFETEALTVAMAATGIGALIIGVGLLGVALYNAFGKNENLNDSLKTTKQLAEDVIGKISRTSAQEKATAKEEYLTNAKGLSAEKALDEYNKKLFDIEKRTAKAIDNANVIAATLPAERALSTSERFGGPAAFNPDDMFKAVNPKKAEQDALVRRTESTQKQNVSIDINDKTGRANVTSDNDMVKINTTKTLGNGFDIGTSSGY